MIKYLDKFNVLDNAQHGFISGHSTETAAVSFIDYVYECLDNGLHVAGLFFDLSLAFDSLSFQFIVDKCYNLGFRGVCLNWLRSYLEGRSIYVKVGRCLSDRHDLNLGVPQGPVLGSILFLLFINDLPVNLRIIFLDLLKCRRFSSSIREFLLSLLADDAPIVVSAPTFEELPALCELLLQSFVKWCHKNNLMINIDKTECIHFTIMHSDREQVIRYLDSAIASKSGNKFLGVHLDNNLKWGMHIDSVCKKLNGYYFAINRVNILLPLESLVNIYIV